MDLRDYLAAIRRRYYVFFPVLFAIIGAHVLWVTYGIRPTYEAQAEIGVQAPRNQAEQIGTVTPTAWVRIPTSTGIKNTLDDQNVRGEIVALLTGKRDFQLREFTHRPLSEELTRVLASFQRDYPDADRFAKELPDLLDSDADEKAGVVRITAQAKSRDSSLAIVWAATEAVVQHFRDRVREDLGYLQEMLKDESERLRKKLTEAEKKWAEIVGEVGFDPVGRRKYLKGQIEDLQNDIDRLSIEQRELARRYRELVQARPLVEGSPTSLQAEKVLAENERVKALEKRILDLKLERDEKLESCTQDHPRVVELNQRIAVLEERLPEVIKEELARSLNRLNDHEINNILYQSRKIALERELKQEQISVLKKKLQKVAGQAIVFLPVRKTCDDVKEQYQTVLAMANNVKFLGSTSLFGQVRVLAPGRTAQEVPIRGRGVGPFVLTVILAFLAALAAVSLLEYVDMRVKSEHDVTRYLNLPLLGVLPRVDTRDLTQIAVEGTPVAERFNTAATLIRTTARELDLHSFAVCSAVAQEGKTTVSLNMAAALARKGARVVLVDADMRMPQIHRILGLSNEVGLSTLLSGWISPRQVIDDIMSEGAGEGAAMPIAGALQGSPVAGLKILTSGPAVQSPAKLVESDRFPQLLRQLTESFDFVIFDTPPIDRVGDALTVASMVDGCIFVVGAGQCEHHDITWAKHLLTNVQANLLGAFLNKYAYRRTRESDYYYYRTRKETRSKVGSYA